MDLLVDKLLNQMDRDAEATAFIELDRKGRERHVASYQLLFDRAASTAVHLQARGLGGKNVLLQISHGFDFVAGFYGCLLAGCTAVPRRVATRSQRDQLGPVLEVAEVAAVLCNEDTRDAWDDAGSTGPSLPVICVEQGRDLSRDWRPPKLREQAIALIQFTSGTTSLPKGVVVSHGALAHNSETIRAAFGFVPGHTVVSWLPFTHDMGLVGHVVQPVYSGLRSVVMPPAAFAGNPSTWLRTIAAYRAYCSGAPNFAYRFSCDRIADESVSDLDLSGWEIAYCGAERIEAHTIRRFLAKFASLGFRPISIYPCYGLAESTLYATGRRGLKTDQPTPGGPTYVSVGAPPGSSEIRIVAPDTAAECVDRTVGEVWIRSESAASGYMNDAASSAATFDARCGTRGGFIRTGDFGYRADAELYLVGRIKDVIKVRGLAVAAEDVELAISDAAQAEGHCLHGCAVIEVEGQDRESIVAVIEAEPSLSTIFSGLKGSVLRTTGLLLDQLIIVERGTLPRTPSGKVQRRNCRQVLESDSRCLALSGATTRSGA
jgi:acyl-CoA synthetase (AMP-forming)/AMP-acid ligase II